MSASSAGVFQIPFGRASRGEIAGNHAQSGSPRGKRHLTSADIERGALAHLMAPRAHAAPGELTGVSIDCTGSAGPVLVEHTRKGHNPKHPIGLEPQWIVIALADGRECTIEVSVTDPAAAIGLDIGALCSPASLTELADYDETDIELVELGIDIFH